ncbi:MAG: Leucinerich repeat [Pseudomonadota bacterium]
MTTLELRLRFVEPTGFSSGVHKLCGAAAACLRTAHLLADGTGSWEATPRPADAPPLHEEATDATLELKPGVTVRQQFSAPWMVEHGVDAQDFTFTAVGWPGAQLSITGNTDSLEATGRITAEGARAAVSLWKALLPALRVAGWRDLTAVDLALGPPLVAAAEAGQVPVSWKLHLDSLHAEVAALVLRSAWKEGTLDLTHVFSRPLTAAALDAVLRALPGGALRDLRLPYGDHSPLPTDPSLLGSLVRLEGAFFQLPSPSRLPRLEHVGFYGRLPTNTLEYPWDELPALRRLDLNNVELPALPAALALSPTLRELSIGAGEAFTLEQTSAYGPLGLERLELRGLPVRALPSSDSLQHLVLTDCTLPFGALPPLPSLKTLTLSSCRWSSLPSGMGQMARLEKLSVDDCPLTTLDALPPLPSLSLLSLRNTRLDTFPAVLGTLPALTCVETWWAGRGMSEPELRARLPGLQHLHVTGS